MYNMQVTHIGKNIHTSSLTIQPQSFQKCETSGQEYVSISTHTSNLTHQQVQIKDNVYSTITHSKENMQPTHTQPKK